MEATPIARTLQEQDRAVTAARLSGVSAGLKGCDELAQESYNRGVADTVARITIDHRRYFTRGAIVGATIALASLVTLVRF